MLPHDSRARNAHAGTIWILDFGFWIGVLFQLDARFRTFKLGAFLIHKPKSEIQNSTRFWNSACFLT
jgi:hypothetical protein